MGLFGKGNRDKQQEILDARKSLEKASTKLKNALFNKNSPKK